MTEDAQRIGLLRAAAQRLTGTPRDYDRLLESIGDARFVLLGEATHGTHEFYRERAIITKRLIRERGFHAVAVEADFPDAYRVNRYVHGSGDDASAVEALGGFKRFPTWMWRNADVLDFIGFLSDHNRSSSARQVGFYGLDLYSLYGSIHAVIDGLSRLDPEAAARARARYACFDHFNQDADAYAYVTGLGSAEPCERQVLEQLTELTQRASVRVLREDHGLKDQEFFVEQNARVVRNAEQYYRRMFGSRVLSWNLRDEHMLQTLEALAGHLDRRFGRSKIVVWAHNSHLGDARRTSMADIGEKNLGQLVRERFGSETFSLGFTTYEGSVTAASDWDAPAERKIVRPALPGSYESLFHATRVPRFLLHMAGGSDVAARLPWARLERAIGVIYRPRTERASHYFRAELAKQFDAVMHIDHTRAVEPLERSVEWSAGEPPETYPFAV
jgi:erythromycin esterase-like protein